jgi:serine/threonine protein kinase
MDLGSVTDARMKVLTRRSALVAEDEAAVKTSAAYRAPELTQVQVDSELTEAVDMWAVGCTMFCLSFGRSPFETSREGVLKLAILNGKYDTPARNTNIRGVTYRWVSISLSSLLHTFFFPYFNLSLTLLLLLFLSFSPPVRSWNPPISVPVT